MGKNYVRLAIGILLVVGAAWLIKCRCVGLKVFTPAQIRDYIQSFGSVAAWIYIILYALNTISVLPPIAALSLAAGLAFGGVKGALYLMAGATLGTTATFMIARYLGRGLIERMLKGKFKELDERLAKNGFMTVLFFRVIPLLPYEVLNYAGGLSRIKFKDYFLATFIGLVPGVVISAFFGGRLGEVRSLKDIFAPKFLVAASLLFMLIVIPVIYQIIRKHHKAEGSR